MSAKAPTAEILDVLKSIVQETFSQPDPLVFRFDTALSETFHEIKTEIQQRTDGLDLYSDVKSSGTWASLQKKKFYSILKALKSVKQDAVIVELGGFQAQKNADILSHFRNYFPMDIEQKSMMGYSATFGRPSIVGNAEALPFKDQSVDVVMTHAFLEHPIHPEKVVNEIIRVIRPGGIVIHNDAWFCRWWQRFGIVGLKSFRKMTISEKIVSIAANISEFPLVRFPPILLRRAWREATVGTTGKSLLRYRKLNPNFELNIGCDEHATASIDPLDVVHVYEQHGFRTSEPLSTLRRITMRPNFLTLVRRSG